MPDAPRATSRPQVTLTDAGARALRVLDACRNALDVLDGVAGTDEEDGPARSCRVRLSATDVVTLRALAHRLRS